MTKPDVNKGLKKDARILLTIIIVCTTILIGSELLQHSDQPIGKILEIATIGR